MLIVVGGEKGGSGKSTIALNLAVCYAHRGADVLLVDSDPQRTSSRWCERRGEALGDGPKVRFQQLLCEGNGEAFYGQLADLRQRYGVVVVDVGGADSVAFRVAVAAADKLISPVMPSECDTETAASVDEVVRAVRGMGSRVEAAFLLSKCSTHPGDDEVKESLDELAEVAPTMPVLSSRIYYRKALRKARRMRLGVSELLNSTDRNTQRLASQAAAEMWALYSEVSGDELEVDEAAE